MASRFGWYIWENMERERKSSVHIIEPIRGMDGVGTTIMAVAHGLVVDE